MALNKFRKTISSALMTTAFFFVWAYSCANGVGFPSCILVDLLSTSLVSSNLHIFFLILWYNIIPYCFVNPRFLFYNYFLQIFSKFLTLFPIRVSSSFVLPAQTTIIYFPVYFCLSDPHWLIFWYTRYTCSPFLSLTLTSSFLSTQFIFLDPCYYPCFNSMKHCWSSNRYK